MDKHTQNAGDSDGDDGIVERTSFSNGRHYHSESNCPYPLSNDPEEVNRLNLQHRAIQQIIQRKYYAPLDEPKRALDIGSGTGIWLKEMAAVFPECQFTGIDIAPLQPKDGQPLNCTFETANVLDGLLYPDAHFDYVRHSLLGAAIPKEKWRPYIKECVRLCASGGWIEMTEANGQFCGGGAACRKLGGILTGAFQAQGLSLKTTDVLDELMREAGLVEVEVRKFKLTIGTSGGIVGALLLKNFRMGCAGMAPLVESTYGMPREDLDQLVLQAEEEIEQGNSFGLLCVYIGRKP
ncbi:S-adenosyl-L-methionine-dependent methyltransferase [Thamnocephalis sphaerospora]|uniref:S-adenosyl-L-methionine-dependent methyltransferase n=1 Tax=Thamnocephalis sphaerospora TaxID=78915 RepID=A0A4P9XKR0_9FUNG|nr:S-adenosyl-L-methionine-dependent methyltransferase [Thamnocephalis sphaerospora]|eukprot:RKP06346.1 S-adenosyl-L-methionine-dependent methyltransferase [Thamnocephalis sphaerospora]